MPTDQRVPPRTPDPATETSVAVVLVTYDSRAHLPAFLDSLGAATRDLRDARLVVADNASRDDSVEIVRRLAPDASVVALDHNRGYAAGINAAAATVRDVDALLVLNPDVRLTEGAVGALARVLAVPGTGVAVPRVVGPDGRTEPSLRRESTVSRALGEALLGGERAGRWNRLGEMVTDRTVYGEGRTVDWASGCAMLVERACFDELGGLDEGFFHGSEETDLCLRARDRGWTVRYQPEALVQHLGGGGAQSPVLRPIMFANRLELYRRRRGAVRAVPYRTALLLNEGLRAARGPAYRATFRRLLRPGHPARRSSPPLR